MTLKLILNIIAFGLTILGLYLFLSGLASQLHLRIMPLIGFLLFTFFFNVVAYARLGSGSYDETIFGLNAKVFLPVFSSIYYGAIPPVFFSSISEELQREFGEGFGGWRSITMSLVVFIPFSVFLFYLFSAIARFIIKSIR